MSNVTPLPLPAVPDTPPPSQDPGRLYTWAEVVRIAEAYLLVGKLHAEERARETMRQHSPAPSGLTLIRGGRS